MNITKPVWNLNAKNYRMLMKSPTKTQINGHTVLYILEELQYPILGITKKLK